MDSTSLPAYSDLILPTVRAVSRLGGSASAQEITRQVLDDLRPSDEMLAVEQPNRPGAAVYLERVQWARSYAKLIGALESPKRGIFLLTALGRELLGMPEEDAAREALRLDRAYRRNRVRRGQATPTPADAETEAAEEDDEAAVEASAAPEDQAVRWQDVLLARLHRLTPDAFEEFVLYLLRTYGLELERVGGSGDEGIDGIGTAPISPVLSSRVAVQVKRYNPDGRAIGREVVALFQRDAQTKGAERAILVTLGKFSQPARQAAILTSPTVDLIDGDRLAELIKDRKLGVRMVTKVDEDWFNRFS